MDREYAAESPKNTEATLSSAISELEKYVSDTEDKIFGPIPRESTLNKNPSAGDLISESKNRVINIVSRLRDINNKLKNL